MPEPVEEGRAPGRGRTSGQAGLPLEVALRRAKRADAAAIARIEQLSFVHPGERFSREHVARLIGNPRAVVIVAQDLRPRSAPRLEAGAQVLGWAAGLVRRHRASRGLQTRSRLVGTFGASVSGRVYAVAVHPHGRGGGIGRRLVSATIDGLRRRGAGRIYLEVRADNHSAIGLYHKLGFVTCRHLPDYYAPGLHAVKMVLE